MKWLEDGRIPLGCLTLLGGREGTGKTTLAYWYAARVTRGQLDGLYRGEPRGVIVAATEDSWAMTIVPRLMAAGADLDLVYRVDVTRDGVDSFLSLPDDLANLEEIVTDRQIALVILDPLLSRLDARLDTHKDAHVRQALEPLLALADRTAAAVLGLIHVSKAVTQDPLTSLMASRAFSAIARAVIYMVVDPDDPSIRLVGTPKENLGRADLPTRACRIEGAKVADTDEGEVWTARLVWVGERSESIGDILEAIGDGADVRTATTEAADWLADFLSLAGGSADSATVKTQGQRQGHNGRTLQRAAARLQLRISSDGFPRHTIWALPIAHGAQSRQDSSSQTTGTTGATAVAPVAPVRTVRTVAPVMTGGGGNGADPAAVARLRTLAGLNERHR